MPTISRFMESNAFIRGLVGPLGGGKSSGCVWDLAQRGVAQAPGPDGVRRSRWVVIRNTNRQLEDSTIRTFLQWFPPHIHGTWLPSKANYTIKSLKAGANEPAADIEFQFRALDRPDQVGNLLSTEYTGGWINEGREVPWAVYDALIGRVGRYPAMRDGGPSWYGLIADTNPPDTESDWYSFFEDKDHAEAVALLSKALVARGLPAVSVDNYAQCFKQPSGLGPLAENLPNLPPGYYERQLPGKSEDWIKVYLRGEYGFTVDGKPVWPEYEDSIHCPADERKWPRTIAGVPVYRSWDFGITPAVVFSQITPDGQWIVVDEMVATDMQFDQFSDEVTEHSARNFAKSSFEDYGDIAGKQRAAAASRTCFEIAWAKGIQMQEAPQAVRLRIEATAKPMRTLRGDKPQFVLHPRCKRLRRALMGGYHFRRIHVSGERYSPEPEKNVYSHVADALGYGGAVLFGSALRGMYPQDDDSDARVARGVDRTRSRTTGY